MVASGPLVFVLDSVERALIEPGDGAAFEAATETLGWITPLCLDHPDPMVDCAALRLRALALALDGRLVAASGSAMTAIARARQRGLQVELARSLLIGAAIERRLRHKASAEAMCLEAAALFASCGLAAWGERVERERERLGLRRGDGIELTPAERGVAELAATGATNREIARRLNLGEKTVEVHLTRAFRKLAIRRRGQLARALKSGEATG